MKFRLYQGLYLLQKMKEQKEKLKGAGRKCRI